MQWHTVLGTLGWSLICPHRRRTVFMHGKCGAIGPLFQKTPRQTSTQANALQLEETVPARSSAFKYLKKQLECAINAAKNGKMSIRQAAEHFKVPYTTLREKFYKKHI